MISRMLETSYTWPPGIGNEELRALNQLPERRAARHLGELSPLVLTAAPTVARFNPAIRWYDSPSRRSP